MASSVFDDKSAPPTRASFERALGTSVPLLEDVEASLREQGGEVTSEWKFYGKHSGWTLAYRRRTRTLMHLVPEAGGFTVIFILGARAVAASRESELSQPMKDAIVAATAHIEGSGVRLPIRSADDLGAVRTLIGIKLAH